MRRPFTISAGRADHSEVLVARWADGDLEGYGEADPGRRVTGEGLDEAEAALTAWGADAARIDDRLAEWQSVPGGHATPAARNALITARLDAIGRGSRRPLRDLLNLPEGRLETSITLSLGPVAIVLEEATARDAEGWTVFKVKLGGPDDEAVISALRDRFPEKRLRVDANEAWSPAVAERRVTFLERHGVELVEQPLPRDRLPESAELAARHDIPIVLDEAVRDSADALEAVRLGAANGINIKLAKCGGPYEARRIVKVARDAGWRVMMGCNLESRLGIAAAAAFAGVIDWADLDSHALLADDPFEGFDTPGGVVSTPEGPGVGVRPRTAALFEPLHP